MPGWLFVTLLLAASTLAAGLTDRPTWFVIVLALVTVISAIVGGVLRPDRRGPGEISGPRF